MRLNSVLEWGSDRKKFQIETKMNDRYFTKRIPWDN